VSRSVKAHILLLALTLVWGATFVLIKSAITQATPLAFNAVRMALAAVVLLLVFARDLRREGVPRGAWLSGGLAGVCLWGGYELQTTGLAYTTPSKSAFLTGVSVVLVPIFLAIGWHRRVNRWTAIGVAAAFAGLYLMTAPAGPAGFALAAVNRGDLLSLGCAVAFALQIIAVGRATARYRFQQVSVVQVVVAAGLMLVTMPAMEQPHIIWSGLVVAAILITGLINTALGFAAQAWAQQFTPPTHTALIFLMEPVFACLTSYVLLGERLGARGTVGAGLILAGVLLSELLGKVAAPQAGTAAAAEMAD
jgi:drug/metabolite transporter (DMT)-like permease